MKIKIENDVFEITQRIKEIDEGYYIVFDTKKQMYELLNYMQPNTYCLTIPYDNLDRRLIDLLLYTNVSNIDNVVNDIDNNNSNIERNALKNVKNQAEYMVKEIYEFSNNSSKNYEINSCDNFWR